MPTVLTLLSMAFVLAASLHDIAARTIPNALPAALAITGAIIGIMSGSAPASVVVAASVFLVAAVCWRHGWLGGGDVKLLGAACMTISPASVPLFIAAVAIGGGILAVVYLVLGRIVPSPGPARPRKLLARVARAEQWRLRRGGPLPYACAIAGGFLFVTL